MGNASVDDTDAAATTTFFFAIDDKSFVPTFNASIHNTSKCRMSRLLVHLCLQASFFIGRTRLYRRGSKHGRIWWGRGWWHQQRHGAMIELYVMYLCRKTMTTYCCVKTIWIIDLCLVVWILYILLYNFLLCDLFWRLTSDKAAKTGVIYINQFIHRLTKELRNIWTRGRVEGSSVYSSVKRNQIYSNIFVN
jgi:hypothetical protein